MKLQVRYSSRASAEYLDILDYINSKFGSEKARKIDIELQNQIEQISNIPRSFPIIHSANGVRRCVFSKQTSIFYRVKDSYLEIISLWDNRMDPSRKKI